MNNPKDDVTVAIPVSSGSSQAFPVPQISNFGDRGDLIEKIKPEAVVEVIRQRLLGREWTNNKWVDVPALQERKLSEVGAWEISNLMLGVSSISVSISKLNERRINERLFRIAKTAQIMLINNWREYGIHSTSQFYYVHEIVFSNTQAVLFQADDASIQDLLKGTVKGTVGDYGTGRPGESATKKIGRMLGLVS